MGNINIMQLYTSFDGRIGRKTFWLAAIALGVVIFIISYIAQLVLGIRPPDPTAVGTPEEALALAGGMVQKSAWISLVLAIIFAIPTLALMVKRRQDKDNNGLDAKIFYAFEVVILLLQGLGLVFNTPGMILSVLLGIFAIYMLVVLGFLKGTTGSNAYGPDPLLAGNAVPV